MEGRALSSNRPSEPQIPVGVQLPNNRGNEVVFEGEGTSDWLMMTDFADEYAMAANSREMEALEPCSLAEAKRHPDWLQWEKAIQEELEVLTKAGTWKLADAPVGANIVGSKWVFRAKKDATGNVVLQGSSLIGT